jgi:ribonuclease HI
VIIAAADGSSLSNPGPAGWAWYIDEAHWASGGWPHGTNNMGELKAVLDLLEQTRTSSEPLRILCDSQYAIKVCTTWLPAWKRRGWRKADNKPILNLDLVQSLDRELAGRAVFFEWVKGHAGHALNEAADQRARAAAEAYQRGVPPDQGPGWGPSTAAGGSTPPPPVPSSTAQAVSFDPPGQPELFGTAFDTSPRAASGGVPGGARVGVPAGTTTGGSDPVSLAAEITDLQRELLDDATQLDRARLTELLHPSYIVHGPGGVVGTRGSVLARPAALTGPVHLDVLGLDQLAPGLVALRYRLQQGGTTELAYALWQFGPQGWQARFQQTTPVA